MDVLGHSQIAITMDLYSHVMPAALREEVRRYELAGLSRSTDGPVGCESADLIRDGCEGDFSMARPNSPSVR